VTRKSIGERDGDQRRWLLALAPPLVAAVLFLPSIGTRVIYIGDEARYALLARTMIDTGDWLLPRIGSEVHMEKTPLFIWAIAALSLGGRRVTELTAVLPAALSGIGGVAATVELGRRLFGFRAGVLGGLILATAWGYCWHARLALADMMVTFFVVVAAAAFWAAVGGGRARGWPMALCWACLGLALSAKGPVGLLPILAFAAFLVSEGGWSNLRTLRPGVGVAIVILVSAPWILPFALQREASYVQSVLVEDFLAPRLGRSRQVSELFFAVGPIVVGLLPWTPFLPSAVRNGWWRAERDEVRRSFRFLLLWVLVYVVAITLVPHKRDRYLLATFPAFALMVGWLWDRWASRPSARALRLHAWSWAALAGAMAVALLAPLRLRPEQAVFVPPTLAQKLVLVALLGTAAALTLRAARAGRPLAMFLAVCVPSALLLAYGIQVFVAGHNRTYDIRRFSERIGARVGPEAEIVTYRYQPLAVQFYAGRPVKRARDVGEVMQVVATGRPVYVIAEDRGWQELSEASGWTWTVVDQADVDGRSISVRIAAMRP
jgi:4-amino-4-deoxy-L-arabinose transferase-like glycosyltransferase